MVPCFHYHHSHHNEIHFYLPLSSATRQHKSGTAHPATRQLVRPQAYFSPYALIAYLRILKCFSFFSWRRVFREASCLVSLRRIARVFLGRRSSGRYFLFLYKRWSWARCAWLMTVRVRAIDLRTAVLKRWQVGILSCVHIYLFAYVIAVWLGVKVNTHSHRLQFWLHIVKTDFQPS